MTPSAKPPITVSLLYLAALGVFFYTSYGFTNWLASTYHSVPSITFDWERHIPFIAWTIAPYWTTNIFYALSVILCRTRSELTIHFKRLLCAQLISTICFILFPLRFSLPKADTSGMFHFLYEALNAFDKPFNQAPSLHVALTVILCAFYFKIMPIWLRWIFLAWSALIIISVLTTYQHHFIDIPTGMLLGLFCVWLFPADGSARFYFRLARHRRPLALASGYFTAALLCTAIAFILNGSFLWLLWPAWSFFLVALSYATENTAIFDKRLDGTIGWPSRLMLLPYLLIAMVNSRLWTYHDKKTVKITDQVYLGRFPDNKDLEPFKTVVDLTCEFTKPHTDKEWHSSPMLDLVSAPPEQITAAANAIEKSLNKGSVLVVCALGYGRSVAVVAAWLIRNGYAKDASSALEQLRICRPKMRLSAEQAQSISEAINATRET